MDQSSGLCLPVQSENKRASYSSEPLKTNCQGSVTHASHLLWISVQASFLHGINGVAQELMSVLLAAKPEMTSNF